MRFDFGLLLLCSLVLLLESCSESNKVSGGTIEVQNALLEKQGNDWYNYGMDLKELLHSQVGKRLSNKFALRWLSLSKPPHLV